MSQRPKPINLVSTYAVNPVSAYTEDCSYRKQIPVVETVGELLEVLKKLPPELPLEGALKPTWFNVGYNMEHLGFIDGDGE